MMKRLTIVLILMGLMVPVVSGSDYFFNNSQEPGSLHFWRYGRQEGSKYFWDYGQKVGSEYFWKYGRKVGSKYFWENGREPGSLYYWLNGREAGSRYFWENGRGPGSEKFWRTGKKNSFLPFFVSLCKSGSIDIAPCDKMNAPDLQEIFSSLIHQNSAPNYANPANINDSELLKDLETTKRNNRTNNRQGSGRQ